MKRISSPIKPCRTDNSLSFSILRGVGGKHLIPGKLKYGKPPVCRTPESPHPGGKRREISNPHQTFEYARVKIEICNAESNNHPCESKSATQNRINTAANRNPQRRLRFAAVKTPIFHFSPFAQPCRPRNISNNH